MDTHTGSEWLHTGQHRSGCRLCERQRRSDLLAIPSGVDGRGDRGLEQALEALASLATLTALLRLNLLLGLLQDALDSVIRARLWRADPRGDAT